MEWEELVKKFEVLGEFFKWECIHIPCKVKRKCGELVIIPMVLEAVGRERLKAKIELSTHTGDIRILRVKRPPKHGLTRAEICIVCVGFDESVGFNEVPDSYEEFANEAGRMLAGLDGDKTIDLVLAKNTLERAYYDLCHGVKKYFKLAKKKASKEQREHWLANIMKYHYHRGLAGVINLCQESRADVSSKIIRGIRKYAEKAQGYCPIDVITLPPA